MHLRKHNRQNDHIWLWKNKTHIWQWSYRNAYVWNENYNTTVYSCLCGGRDAI